MEGFHVSCRRLKGHLRIPSSTSISLRVHFHGYDDSFNILNVLDNALGCFSGWPFCKLVQQVHNRRDIDTGPSAAAPD